MVSGPAGAALSGRTRSTSASTLCASRLSNQPPRMASATISSVRRSIEHRHEPGQLIRRHAALKWPDPLPVTQARVRRCLCTRRCRSSSSISAAASTRWHSSRSSLQRQLPGRLHQLLLRRRAPRTPPRRSPGPGPPTTDRRGTPPPPPADPRAGRPSPNWRWPARPPYRSSTPSTAANDRNPSRRHTALFSNVAATTTRNAAKSRSASAHSSTTRAASGASSTPTSTSAHNGPDRTAATHPADCRPQRRTCSHPTERV